ncbi:MAG: LptA/OstA family protein [Thermodesulfobacteriota bacterium]
MNRLFPAIFLFTFVLYSFSSSVNPFWAGATEADGRVSDKIHIRSNTLTIDTQNMTAEFNGDVKASQGDMVIQADRLTVHYEKNLAAEGTEGMQEQAVRKIIAIGGVRIHIDNRVAVADQAVYSANDSMFVLTGEQVEIRSGNDSIKGEKIMINRANGKMDVVGSEKAQAEATFGGGKNGMK